MLCCRIAPRESTRSVLFVSKCKRQPVVRHSLLSLQATTGAARINLSCQKRKRRLFSDYTIHRATRRKPRFNEKNLFFFSIRSERQSRSVIEQNGVVTTAKRAADFQFITVFIFAVILKTRTWIYALDLRTRGERFFCVCVCALLSTARPKRAFYILTETP